MFALTPELRELASLLYATGEDRKEADRKIMTLLNEIGQPFNIRLPFIWYTQRELEGKYPVTLNAKISAWAGFQVGRVSESLASNYPDFPTLLGSFWIRGRENYVRVYDKFNIKAPNNTESVWAVTPGCVLASLIMSTQTSSTVLALRQQFGLTRPFGMKGFVELYKAYTNKPFPLSLRSKRKGTSSKVQQRSNTNSFTAVEVTPSQGDFIKTTIDRLNGNTPDQELKNVVQSIQETSQIVVEAGNARVTFNPANQSLDTLLRDRLVIQQSRKDELEREILERMENLAEVDTEIKKLRAFLEMDTLNPESNGSGNSKTLGSFVKLNKAS